MSSLVWFHRERRSGSLRVAARASRLPALLVPPEHWGVQRRLMSAVTIAIAAFAVAMHGLHVGALAGLTAERATLHELERRIGQAQAELTHLPALRRQAMLADEAQASRLNSPTMAWQALFGLAERSGLILNALEPAPAEGEGAQRVMPMRLAARGGFADVMAFLRGLGGLPSLVVPMSLAVTRESDELLFESTLHVFGALPASVQQQTDEVAADENGPPSVVDPFDAAALARLHADALRLVGFMREGVRGFALFETPDGAIMRLLGEAIGSEQLVHVGMNDVTLAGGASSRRLALAEEAR
ncbi:hypothetical protein [Trinickia fusca]|uniref:Pilus assembly protein n=1 Tax=Trinickia fusca TaxID=2419777 RepID=A0A494X353_9BURK|nr:hypothetical protein [Trinickia fusca]RKP44041.1 hypothetical protein D7S89_24235 [Trinickia fusca]